MVVVDLPVPLDLLNVMGVSTMPGSILVEAATIQDAALYQRFGRNSPQDKSVEKAVQCGSQLLYVCGLLHLAVNSSMMLPGVWL